MVSYFSKFSNKKNIIIGLLLVVIFNLLAFPMFSKIFFQETFNVFHILDFKFGFDKSFVFHLFEKLQENGRKAYKFSTIFIDFPYPIIYGITYSLLFLKLFEYNNIIRFKELALLPLAILFFDVLENTGIIYLLSNYPKLSENIIFFTSIANQSKWVAAIICILLFIVLIIISIKKKLNQR